MEEAPPAVDAGGVTELRLWRLRPVAALLGVLLTLVVGVSRSEAAVPTPAPSQQDRTPACPVSPSQPVCAWNVPADDHNPFGSADYGQCPYWAAEKYPAIVLDEAADDPYGNNWNGFTWLEHAEAESLPVSATPSSGDLAVWAADSSDPYGHVAFVEAVLPHGIIVSQMDGQSAPPFPAMQGTTEYIPQADLDYFAANSGLRYVVTGDPSTTPVARLEQSPSDFADTAPAAGAPQAATAPGPRRAVRHHARRKHTVGARHHAERRS